MQDIIELTPELLLEQSQEMQSLCAAYENLFSNISADLSGINGSWSDLLANNFSGKIGSAQKTFSGALTMLSNVANGTRNVAETMQEADAEWASKIGGALNTMFSSDAGQISSENQTPEYEKKDIGDYSEKLSAKGLAGDAEYAKLCQLWQEADRDYENYGDGVLRSVFKQKLQECLPENNPLHDISVQQMQVTRSSSGFSAITIQDGENAIVIFAGTNFDTKEDVASDALILTKDSASQVQEANKLISELSKNCSNIVVTGHSLGGYLATDAALNNSVVSKCVVFDPIGRNDNAEQLVNNYEQYSKVKSYVAEGSPVSHLLGREAVNPSPVDVEECKDNGFNHGIKYIYEGMSDK